MKDNKIFEMSVSDVYPHYVNKVEKGTFAGRFASHYDMANGYMLSKLCNALMRVTVSVCF